MTDSLIEEARAWPGVEWNALSANRVGDLLKRLADALEEREWRDISSAPRDGTPILVAVTDPVHPSVVGEAWWQGEGGEADWWWANTSPGDYYADPIRDRQHGQVTHWQPLPLPPLPKDPDQ